MAASLPGYFKEVLQRCIEPLRNEETIYLAIATRAAFLKDEDYKSLIEQLRKAAMPHQERVAAVNPANETALAWFIANGIPTA